MTHCFALILFLTIVQVGHQPFQDVRHGAGTDSVFIAKKLCVGFGVALAFLISFTFELKSNSRRRRFLNGADIFAGMCNGHNRYDEHC